MLLCRQKEEEGGSRAIAIRSSNFLPVGSTVTLNCGLSRMLLGTFSHFLSSLLFLPYYNFLSILLSFVFLLLYYLANSVNSEMAVV